MSRKTLVWAPFLLFAIGLFLATSVTTLFVLHHRETQAGVLAQNAVAKMKKDLETSPKDEALKERIRQADLQLRDEYFANRQRFKTAGPLLLGTLALWVALAGWYFSRTGNQPPWAGDPAKEMGRIAEEVAAYQAQLNQLKSEIEQREGELGLIQRRALAQANAPREQRLSVALLLLGGCCFIGGLFALGWYVRPMLNPAKITAPATEQPVAAETPAAQTTVAATITTETLTDIWPNFRGPNNLGIAAPGDYPTSFNVAENKNILWKTPVPAAGKSSPVVAAGKIFLTGGGKEGRRVLCFDAAKGTLLWDKVLQLEAPGAAETEVFQDTGFAACTPATDGKRVYAIFGSGELAAFDLDGKQVWARHLGVPESTYTYASSLLMADGLLIVQMDRGSDPGKSVLFGINPETGKDVFSTPRPVPNSWSSPALITTPTGKQIITAAPEWIIAYDPLKGSEIWKVKIPHADIAASLAFANGMAYYANDGVGLLAIRSDGKGDVSATKVVWKSDDAAPDTSSPVCDGKYYMQANTGRLACYDAAQGKLLWEKDFGANASSSIILAGGLAYLACEDGKVHVWKPADTYQEAGTGEVGEAVFATPAFVGGKIYLRGAKNLYGIGK